MKILITLTLSLLIISSMQAEKVWVKKHEKLYEFIVTIDCLDDKNCIALIDSVQRGKIKLIKTSDAGNTWHVAFGKDPWVKPWLTYRSCRKALYQDENHIYITYNENTVLDVSEDGGKTFRTVFFDDSTTEDSKIIREFAMYNNKIGIASTWYSLFITRNNWNTFTTLDLKTTKFHRGEGDLIYFIDSNNVALKDYPTGYGFLRYNISENSWHPWSEAEAHNNNKLRKNMRKIYFVNDSVAYACGAQQYSDTVYFDDDIVWKTTNKGKDWNIVLFRREEEGNHGLKALSFKDEQHGVAAGSYGKMVETTDGGSSWTYIEPPAETGEPLFTLKVAWAGDYLLVGSENGGIFRLQDPAGLDEQILESTNINIRQTKDKLLISIKDVVAF